MLIDPDAPSLGQGFRLLPADLKPQVPATNLGQYGYAFGTSLGGQRVLDAARVLARQSGIPKRRLTLVNRARTYSHNDPNSAAPKNAFVDKLVPFLERITR